MSYTRDYIPFQDIGFLPFVGLTPFLRPNEVNFAAKNLKPGATANLFFDEIRVNDFSQRASYINVVSNTTFSTIKLNQGIYGANSNAYAEVIGTSVNNTQNLIYVNDNFITLLIEKGSTATNLTDNEFKVDEFIYQTTNGIRNQYDYTGGLYLGTTFTGFVKKWKKLSESQGLLFIKPGVGRINSNSSIANATSNLWNWTTASTNVRKAVRIDANNRFIAGETLRYVENDASLVNVAATNAYTALSSTVSAANVGNLKTIVISTNNPTRDGLGSSLVGQKIYIVDGTNVGFNATITNVSTNSQFGWTEATLSNTLSYTPDNSTIYSIGNHTVDDIGALYGIFHIPAYQNLRWLSGERLFTITDSSTYNNNSYNMRAIAKYTSVGFWNTSENARGNVVKDLTPSTLQIAPNATVLTQKINDRKFLSQTFFTPKGNQVVDGVIKNAYGVFVSSIDLYFKTKPTNGEELLPFTIAISKVVDGLPSNEIVAERTLEPAYITTSNTAPAYGTATYTRFSFQDPVYLLPATEYAIQLITESPDYEVWTSVMGDEYVDAGGNTRRVSEQPYVGNFFKSQNASQWTPILNQDLMFTINRASFSTSPSVVYFKVDKDLENRRNIFMDAVKLTATEQQFAPTNISYELSSYLTDETVAEKVDLINNEYYSFGKDTTVSSVTSKRRRFIKAASNDVSVNLKVTLSTTDETVTPIINRERIGLIAIQNIVNNAGIANNLITVTDGGNHSNAANIVVTISAPDVGSNTATANVLSSMLVSNKITGINITNPGAGYFTTPTITISEAGASSNAKAVINGETDAAGGNILTKYQTKVVTLKDGFDAGDLVVRLQTIKPQGTEVAVYFKVLSAADSDTFVSKTWQRMTPVTDATSKDQATPVSIEYRYNLTNGRISYFDGRRAMPLNGTFKYFAVKIRMTAQDPTVVPLVESMTVLAIPADPPVDSLDGGFFSGT